MLLPRVDEFAHRMAERIQAQEPLYREGMSSAPTNCADRPDNLLYVFGRLAGDPNIGIEARARPACAGRVGRPLSPCCRPSASVAGWSGSYSSNHADHEAQDTLLRCAADIWAVSDDLARRRLTRTAGERRPSPARPATAGPRCSTACSTASSATAPACGSPRPR